MNEMTPESVSKWSGVSIELAVRLLGEGIERGELDSLLGGELPRMNAIGSLRAFGYDVQGGRKGRTLPYKVLGWAPKPEKETSDRWTGEAKSVLDFLHQHPRVEDGRGFESSFRNLMSYNPSTHENSWLYLRAYELARNPGFHVQTSSGSNAVVIERFPNVPRLKVFKLDGRPKSLLKIARKFAPASLAFVPILNLSHEDVLEMKSLDPKGSISKHVSSVVNVSTVLMNLRDFFSKNELRKIRRLQEKRITFPGAQTEVIDLWRTLNETKHRQLAITRDYIGAKYRGPGSLQMSWHHQDYEHCLATYINEISPSDPTIALGIAAKALVYPPYGLSGVGNASYLDLLYLFLDSKVEWFNQGAYDGGNPGLRSFKERFSDPKDDSISYIFTTSYSHKEA